VLLGLFAGVLAQTCAAMLPAPHYEYEWLRDGRPHAYETLLRSTDGQRVYQRQPAGGGDTTERALSCSTHEGALYFTERSSLGVVRIPVGIGIGGVRRVAGTTVRRIANPPGSAANTIWFAVASPGVRLYALRRGAGITEIRMPRPGGTTVYRAVVRDAGPARRAAEEAEALRRRVDELETNEQRLLDSIGALQDSLKRRIADCIAFLNSLPAELRTFRCEARA